MNLRRHSGVIAEVVHGERYIRGTGDGQGFSIIQGFQLCEFFGPLFDQVCQFPDQFASFRYGQFSPRSVFESVSRRFYSSVDICLFTLGNAGQDSVVGRVQDLKSISTGRVDSLPINQQFLWGGEKIFYR